MDANKFEDVRGHIDLDELVISDEVRQLLRYAPDYASMSAALAIGEARKLQEKGVLRNGIYYLVLIDLVGSTEFMSRFGNQRGDVRIETFISGAIEALSAAPLKNVSIFLKEIGDAVLLCFSHFPDILIWRSELITALEKSDIEFRTCVHLGEVFLNGMNPLALAVSQLFKMEKAIQGGSIGLTDAAFHAAWPTVLYPEYTFLPAGAVELPGYPEDVPIMTVDLEFLDDQDALGPTREREALEAVRQEEQEAQEAARQNK